MHKKALVLLLLAAAAPGAATAATYTVSTLSDSVNLGDGCSLREAVAAHNSSSPGGANECGAFDAGADTIRFAPGLTGTIYLDPRLGELVLTAPALTIQGPGAASLAIHGGKVMSVLVLDTEHPPQLTLRRLTLRNGYGSPPQDGGNPQGGGIRMNVGGTPLAQPTTIVVEDSVLFANVAPSHNSRGAAIISYGKLILRRTVVKASDADAGAIWHSGTAQVEDSEFSENQGRHLSAGIVFVGEGPWTIRRSLFRGNVLQLNGSAAVHFFDDDDEGLIENCTFVGNTSSTGSVVGLQTRVTVRNSTFSGNGFSAIFPDCGIVDVQASHLELHSNLFVDNGVPDVSNHSLATVTVNATYNLFDTQPASLPPAIPCAPTTAGGGNLCGVTAPGLGPLASLGGPTQIMALLPGSPAIDAGDNPGFLSTDQRGTGFARTVGADTDIGAYEVQKSSFGTNSFW